MAGNDNLIARLRSRALALRCMEWPAKRKLSRADAALDDEAATARTEARKAALEEAAKVAVLSGTATVRGSPPPSAPGSAPIPPQIEGSDDQMSGWNYRVMRHESNDAVNDEIFYAIHEVYYNKNDTVKSWTKEVCGSPCGETLEEMTRDLAWIMTALSKPVLDASTGKEIEPAAMLADDLAKMLRDTAPAQREEG